MILCVSLSGQAHEREGLDRVVIDTDLGIDDIVALSMALQDPDLELVALVASEGVADASTATDQLTRVADFFNRSDLELFAAAEYEVIAAPPWRQEAGTMIDAALPSIASSRIEPAAPSSYGGRDRETTVVVLGPLANLAAAVTNEPRIAEGIGQVVVAGDPESGSDWNLAADPSAVAVVRSTGVPLVFVRPKTPAAKPDGWYAHGLAGGQGTALGETLLDRLLADPRSEAHYMSLSFHDELAVLYLLKPELFREVGQGIFEPVDGAVAAGAIAAALSRGRQHKDRVVIEEESLPESALRADVRARRAAILTNNGPDEWFAQILLNELHEHLGAYSIIGVKMGLRAAELLNAPQHSMQITSATPVGPPLSCLNDGLIVSTGSTPGRGLFRHVPGPPGTVKASFSYNGSTLALRLKDEYRNQIRSAIEGLLSHSTLEDNDYWDGVRELGLWIWQDWHRRDLFEVSAAMPMKNAQLSEDQP